MLLPSFTLIVAFGVCCFTVVFSLSIPSCSFDITSCKLFSFNIVAASFSVFPSIFGTSISCFISSFDSASFIVSKYGNTSPNICAPIGAATPPPWVILTTQKL